MKPVFPVEPARLEFDHVTVAYNGRPVLDDVTFDVPHGAQVAVVGPNGAGKSTLFKALVGLLPLAQRPDPDPRPAAGHATRIAWPIFRSARRWIGVFR